MQALARTRRNANEFESIERSGFESLHAADLIRIDAAVEPIDDLLDRLLAAGPALVAYDLDRVVEDQAQAPIVGSDLDDAELRGLGDGVVLSQPVRSLAAMSAANSAKGFRIKATSDRSAARTCAV